jgi:hypothetical protein
MSSKDITCIGPMISGYDRLDVVYDFVSGMAYAGGTDTIAWSQPGPVNMFLLASIQTMLIFIIGLMTIGSIDDLSK